LTDISQTGYIGGRVEYDWAPKFGKSQRKRWIRRNIKRRRKSKARPKVRSWQEIGEFPLAEPGV
jgi:hypothetical protein